MDYKLVIAVRHDLNLSRGKLAVQVAHGAVSCVLTAKRTRSNWVRAWYNEGQRKIVVKVETEAELHRLKTIANKLKLPTALVQDAGLTEIPPNTITCLAIGPGPNAIVDQVTGNLPTL
jgi:PTH2 family peptidyl-tRNA hydrolase